MTETVIALGGVVVLLAGALVGVVKQRRNGSGDERRVAMAELQENVKEIRATVQDIRVDVAGMKKDIEHLKERP